MDILFVSAKYIYPRKRVHLQKSNFEELPLFEDMDFANKLKQFVQEGNTIVFIDTWCVYKEHNKELMHFFGSEKERGDILFYTYEYPMKKMIDHDYNFLSHSRYLEDISLGTNWNDIDLLLDRIVYFYHKQNIYIDNISIAPIIENGNITMFEERVFESLTEKIKEYSLKKNHLCTYQTCEREPIKILFTDKDGTILHQGITDEQYDKNIKALQEFTDQGNIVVVLTSGHGVGVYDAFPIGYNNPNLYGLVISKMATVCINNTGEIIDDEEYPSLPIAIGHNSDCCDKKEAVKLFLEYFLERGYTFSGIYVIGDSENDFGMLEYVDEIGGISNLIGRDIDSFSAFIENIKDDIPKNERWTYQKFKK